MKPYNQALNRWKRKMCYLAKLTIEPDGKSQCCTLRGQTIHKGFLSCGCVGCPYRITKSVK